MVCCSDSSHLPKFYTIPFSHFCDAARWALTVAGVEFQEVPYLPGVHMFFSPVAKLRRRGEQPDDFTGKDSTVPLLVAGDGSIIGYDSWQCIERAGKVPLDVKGILDTVVGPCVRTIAYSHMLIGELGGPGDAATNVFCRSEKIPSWQRFLWRRGPFRKTVRKAMYEDMVREADYVQAAREKLEQGLTQLEAKLDKEPFIQTGDPPSAAAIAFAALLAPLVMPPNYLMSFYGETLVAVQDLPPAMQDEIQTWRKTPAGQWAMQTYASRT